MTSLAQQFITHYKQSSALLPQQHKTGNADHLSIILRTDATLRRCVIASVAASEIVSSKPQTTMHTSSVMNCLSVFYSFSLLILFLFHASVYVAISR